MIQPRAVYLIRSRLPCRYHPVNHKQVLFYRYFKTAVPLCDKIPDTSKTYPVMLSGVSAVNTSVYDFNSAGKCVPDIKEHTPF